MPVTYETTQILSNVEGNRVRRILLLDLDGTYDTGGFDVSTDALGVNGVLDAVIPIAITNSTGVLSGTWSPADDKLLLYESGAAGASQPQKGNGETVADANVVLDVLCRGAL